MCYVKDEVTYDLFNHLIPECDSQHYGSKCNMSCSSRHCVKSSSCDATGICDGGCEAGWTGDDCTEKVATHTPSQQPEAASFPIAAVVGAVVGVVVILLLVLAVILIRRRRGKSHGRSTHKPVAADNVKPTQAEDIGMYMNIGFDNDEKPTLSPEKTSAKQMKARRQTESQGNSAGEAVSTTGSKDMGKGGTGDLDLQNVEEEEDYDLSQQPAQVEDKPEAPDRNYYNLDDNGRDHVIPVSELQKRVEEMTPASAEEEFKRLPDGYVHSYDESQLPENKGKNRFRGYYPYDYNRVVLHRVSDDKDGDYINASYLDGYKAEKRYIAAQGPYRPEVVVDFWRMIYQEQSTTIVMVTGLVEAGKMMCLQYWPEKGTSIYGDISVTKETETQLANYTVTKLSVHNKSEGKIHHVHHFHFTSWPDHGVPDTSALLEFMWRVKATTRHQTQPIIVHCSAGIGRTGTYIAIESLVGQAAAEGFVDVVSFVSNMRGQRKNMKQTKEQYLFLYQAVAMAVSEGDTSLDADAIRQIDLNHVSSLTMGNKNVQEHLEALGNTSETGLPGDHITTVASYTSRNGFFIITSQVDKEDLWNQMYNSDSRTLITLATETQILLPSMDSPVSTSRLTASLQTSKVISNDVILNSIDLTINGADVTSAIQHYHVTGSTHDSSVTLLIDSLLTWMSDPERGPCTIVSHSVSEARFLVLLVNIASRLQDDSRVDVISNMRRLHSTLGGPPFSQEDVRRCVEFAQRRLESPELYANL
ncbi:receptor-type tyrosine-protein phosphatase T-like isoform X2 [Haliotis rubra]|uniref:receptor-type tyrosine-protein phosphatase T-like isoform X2 n=1 Tax=Haliotis rubra TaxID=36100 RepID=UPI001EE56754|nr:receptor-type tyrosine-protein phosphatase T-like isoform X2 [Haliotis rubra]